MDTEPLLCDRFRVGKLLGRGGMGAVYEAHDGRLMREVAIKRILALEVSADDRERIVREARTVAALSSPHIVQVFDLVGDDSELCIVMEKLRGKALSAHLTEDGLTDAQLFEILAQALVGIADAHAAGVIHRDIKPENIFVVDRTPLLAKVLDFGIAKSMDHSTTLNGLLMGTPAYMAPEQVKCLPLTPRVDIFAFGVILYRHFTNRYPFGERTGPGYLADVCAGNYQPIEIVRPDLPAQVVRLVNRALAPEPRERTESARVLREELLACLSAMDADTVRVSSATVRAQPTPTRTPTPTSMTGPTIAAASTTPTMPARAPKRTTTAIVAAATLAALVLAVMTFGIARSKAADEKAHATEKAELPTATPPSRDDTTTLPVVVVPSPPKTAAEPHERPTPVASPSATSRPAPIVVSPPKPLANGSTLPRNPAPADDPPRL